MTSCRRKDAVHQQSSKWPVLDRLGYAPYSNEWWVSRCWLFCRWGKRNISLKLYSVSNHQPDGCLLNRLFRHRSKKKSKLHVADLCAGNSPGTGEFPAQMASNAENVSIWWRHHDSELSSCGLYCTISCKAVCWSQRKLNSFDGRVFRCHFMIKYSNTLIQSHSFTTTGIKYVGG